MGDLHSFPVISLVFKLCSPGIAHITCITDIIHYPPSTVILLHMNTSTVTQFGACTTIEPSHQYDVILDKLNAEVPRPLTHSPKYTWLACGININNISI